MLRITVPEREYYDDASNFFITVKSQTLLLEHSLLSLSKWESKWHKPFLIDPDNEKYRKTDEEALDYIRCMTINYQNVDPRVYNSLTDENIKEINDYINDPMTATTFSNRAGKRQPRSKEIVTSEVLYYDMTVFQIPFECEKWHLNRLLTLINVCRIKNSPKTKMKRSDVMSRNRALNKQRKAKMHTHG